MRFPYLLSFAAAALVATAAGVAACGTKGDMCRYVTDCAPGFHCEGGFCRCNGSTADLPLGSACVTAECHTCAADLLCNYFPDECQPLGSQAAGEPCSDSRLCMTDLICNAGNHECEPIHHQDVGGPCAENLNCLEGLRCHPLDFVCAPLGQDGERCRLPEDCVPGLVCLSTEIVCRPPRGPGEECGVDEDCAEGLVCDHSSFPGTCQ